MKIYALAMGAWKTNGANAVAVGATDTARSEEEAVGIGIRMLRDDHDCASKDGWRGHFCVATEIPADWLPDAERVRELEAEASFMRQQLDALSVERVERLITTEAEYETALTRAALLMDAEAGTLEERELSALASAICEYERRFGLDEEE